jgi:hypothetical protein
MRRSAGAVRYNRTMPGRAQDAISTEGATAFPQLNELLAELLRRARAILDDVFVGAYLVGSFALGDADAASDCDFLVVSVDRLTVAQVLKLRDLHEEIPTWSGYWAYNIEGSYAPRSDLRTLDALNLPWLYVNRGGREMEWSPHCNALDARWVLRERAPTLAGAPPREFACEVPAELLRREARRQIETFLDDLLTWTSLDISWSQRYAVEAPSRMLYTLEHGEVISKRRALEWARDAMPGELRDVIVQVLEDRFVPWNDPARPGSVERSLAFIEYATQRAQVIDR